MTRRCGKRVPWLGIFFFSSRRRHTRSYGDWSSDVCSSDLTTYYGSQTGAGLRPVIRGGEAASFGREIGRASCRERVKISVVAGALRKTKHESYSKHDGLGGLHAAEGR